MADPLFPNDCIGVFGVLFGHRFKNIYDPADQAPMGMVCDRCGFFSGPDRINWVTRRPAQRDGPDNG